ncbi:MAG: hypothetical protein GX607_03855 [Myxococcales bacterium]|nr:hypothetical protein [Myxococcales bacterium]
MQELGAAPGLPSGRVIIDGSRLGGVPSGQLDALGRPRRVACVSCHAQRSATSLPDAAGELREFHAGLTVRHGELHCSSCHDDERTHELRLASGEVLPGSEALQLCAQCHGPQTRDYRRGSHGGMRGYWDLSRGERRRNHCVDCHDPHEPAYRGGHPVHPPRDRFLSEPTHAPEAPHD